ncbi:hypothetical protein CLAFUW4_08784 [Fulvia fulva]|uniref:Uncharacterized protein n=1 Tax=Passalora fulva TaxID=5499 RepID=A0A9Q8PH60_PASFU|nr:uncharacterized protein CLAFUR5_08891 [Fulvia fulva]KAK4613676.1 hypothetical protein CLAFUR4_08790 [Fulvia fulva]KAK4614457.1 hypothetical protein CLAFUR0_08782 [Fulvia fulva]UJO22342.1 hypothetical protein CLAFUR5_08891 [Fulvia fulva]WPV20277.1 hypothetical protein CLAFUW4_08784 [Fulvia fulva]WPV34925.1 hypothetical protein CLAFUW7_08785 [Fulvia fulva]
MTTSNTSTPQRFWRNNVSPAPWYPIKGIYYFATHRFLHPLLRSRIIPLTLLSTCVLAILFLTAYLPIVAFLALFHYRGSAWVNGTFFILGVGSLLIQVLFEAIFVDHTQVDIFDAVLVAEGYEGLVKKRRPISEDIDEADPYKRLGPRDKGAQYAPFSFRQIFEFVLFLPLNFVPFVGVPLFLLLTGYRAGPLLNWRYFALKEFTKKQRNQYIKSRKRRWEYMWFGTTYMILQLIPVVAMLFLLTSAAGSALWSVHMEQEQQRLDEHTDFEDDADQPPEYTDEP